MNCVWDIANFVVEGSMSIYLPSGRRELNVKAVVAASRGLLRDYEPSDGPFWSTSVFAVSGGPLVLIGNYWQMCLLLSIGHWYSQPPPASAPHSVAQSRYIDSKTTFLWFPQGWHLIAKSTDILVWKCEILVFTTRPLNCCSGLQPGYNQHEGWDDGQQQGRGRRGWKGAKYEVFWY